MVKLTGPMFSLGASGTLAKAVTFATWKGRAYARTRVIPSNPRTGLQVGMRAGITAAPPFWNVGLNDAGRLLWNDAVGAEAISGFNLFTRVGQQNIRNNYGYRLDYTDDDLSDTPAAPAAPSADQDGTDVDITWTHEAAAATVLIFHGEDTGFTANVSSLIAHLSSGVETWTHRNPGLGAHYYDIRSAGTDGGVGALAGEFDTTVV